MQVTLQNIGLIKESTILLDGLTVITGPNNSGKTTVGKVVYALIDAVSDLHNKAHGDRQRYISKRIDAALGSLEILRFLGRFPTQNKKKLPEWAFIYDHRRGGQRRIKYQNDMDSYAHKIYDDLQKINVSSFVDNEDLSQKYSIFNYSNKDIPIKKMLQEQINKATAILENLFASINRDPELIDYARASINRTLGVEFAGQIQPVGKKVRNSSIRMLEGENVFFSIEIVSDKVKNTKAPIFFGVPYSQAYFIDNPFILDSADQHFIKELEDVQDESFLYTDRILRHDEALKSILRKGNTNTLFEETIIHKNIQIIKKELDKNIPGKFEFGNDGEYYIQNGHKLKVSNMATGSKMFSIIKLLLEKGRIDETTMLILDEPETHLHPSWQNAFAEIIILLVKKLNVNILLTTHSSNFMLAIDANMRKHDISSKTNFYQTKCLEDGFVEYKCVNEDLGKIYADFLQYFSDVKILRDSFLPQGN
ncbi:AAA family ATPase [Bilophila wadsworthia]|uniref:AAA family ATPase n=1 Tax=Bilophila wadsworthia TaxID=35833 RepID=UPI00267741B1|nr:AAA family ATPase [Bilophila wadsworthia]